MKITVEHLDAHRGGRRVIKDVCLEVPTGAVLGLIGPNGSGKSTLLRALCGIDTPSGGTVRYDGIPIASLGRRQLAQRVAFMTQEHNEEFDMPVLELVLLGRIPHGKGFGRDSDADIAHAQRALDQVGARHLAQRSFSALSGGERQRVLFARALTQDTPVLVLDEPTNHLDIAHQLELLDLIRATNRTVMIALHDLNLAARSCDEIAVLADGSLVSHGSPEDVLGTELIRRVFTVESTAVTHPATGQPHFLFDVRTPRDEPQQSNALTTTPKGLSTP
ncbi:ABC transporter ATP-binding protein [Nesterenkonia sp. AN1]|uniref:ABC transporter ATP-binding protein n=1 Tax=Nesterenkonia sp. AN1 TaxID=652017 RepID=UPI00044DD636|nr:ABC transporter ATP-binding protein [Nesterenkonia sp. AN1]EXF23984.1 ABC transporter ATP-binding protein [Nesterenkonia sp. AN1]